MSGGAAGSGAKSGCDIGPLITGDCEGAGSGAGIFCTLGLSMGLGTARSSGLGFPLTCALAIVTGAIAKIRTTKTLVSSRMSNLPLLCPSTDVEMLRE
jgi:hypothetical protein